MTPPWPDRVAEAVTFLRARGIAGPFDCAIVLGSGLARLAETVLDPVEVPYRDIPHVPTPGVAGHGGRLIAGRLAGRPVLLFAGRAHHYETGDPAAMRVPIGVAARLGAAGLLLTNAAGSTRPDLGPGSLVALSDHIALSGPNPLIGETGDGRFVPMLDAYDPALRARLHRAAIRQDIPLAEGVYLWFSGPSFETPAEIRMARALGADLVGMSTVPETILARFYGLRVAAVSVVTNLGSGLAAPGGGPSHAETTRVAGEAAASLARLVEAFVAEPADG